jgi:hypothetical protein
MSEESGLIKQIQLRDKEIDTLQAQLEIATEQLRWDAKNVDGFKAREALAAIESCGKES